MNRYQQENHISGFTLIETLVALVVLSIGLLGLAGLQAASLRANQTSLQSSQAAILAYDVTDRIRANSQATAAYHLPTATENANCRSTTGCTPVEMAAHDFYEWNMAVGQLLPGGQGIVCIDSDPNDGTGPDAADHSCDNNGNVFAVKIWWDDDRNATTNNQLFFTSFQP